MVTKKITKREPAKPADESAIDRFIGGAPDAKPEKKGLQRGKREQISHTIPPELLAKLDEVAKAKGLTRAGLINLAISEYCEKN